MQVYLDTNIYLDYLENRSDNLRPLGEFAFQLLTRSIACEFKIIISDIVLKELDKYITKEKIKQILTPLSRKDKIISVTSKFKHKRKARSIKRQFGIPFFDALHYILAKENNAEYLITNDKHFFELPEDGILITKPNLL